VTIVLLTRKYNPTVLFLALSASAVVPAAILLEGILHGLRPLLGSGSREVYNIGTVDVITADQIAEIVVDELGLKGVKI